jgi:hypothetical protein
MPPWLLAVEVAKHLVVAAVVAGLAAGIGTTAWPTAVLLGLALWVGFPVTVATGRAACGDWLVKLLLIAVIVGIWK